MLSGRRLRGCYGMTDRELTAPGEHAASVLPRGSIVRDRRPVHRLRDVQHMRCSLDEDKHWWLYRQGWLHREAPQNSLHSNASQLPASRSGSRVRTTKPSARKTTRMGRSERM